MSKSDTFENDFLKQILQAVGISGLTDNTATSPLGTLYLALHTADPGETGSQTTNEVAYTGYARVGVARSTAGFSIAANVATLVNPASFPACTGGTSTAGYWSLGTAQTGAGKVLWSGQISPTISISNGVTPQLSAATNITED